MIVDTSAWVEFLRGTGSKADCAVADALREGQPIAAPGLVIQEVLQGCRSDTHAAEVRRLLESCARVEPVYPETYAHAAALYRRCRKAGRTVRATVDCLLGALALEHDLAVLTLDRDFEVLRSVAGVRVVRG